MDLHHVFHASPDAGSCGQNLVMATALSFFAPENMPILFKAVLTSHAQPQGCEAESELEVSRVGVREAHSENVGIFLAKCFHDT